MNTRVLISLTILIVGLHAGHASATGEAYLRAMGGRSPYDASREEIERLPGYCKVKLPKWKDIYRSEYPKWADFLSRNIPQGAGFTHTHHYCAGLVAMLRAQEGLGDRSALLKEAVGQFEYMIRHCDPRFVLMAEIYYNMGRAKLGLGAADEAIQFFLKAVAARPDYEPAYVELITQLEQAGQLQDAIRTAEAGLKQVPTSKFLSRKIKELRGRFSSTP